MNLSDRIKLIDEIRLERPPNGLLTHRIDYTHTNDNLWCKYVKEQHINKNPFKYKITFAKVDDDLMTNSILKRVYEVTAENSQDFFEIYKQIKGGYYVTNIQQLYKLKRHNVEKN